MKTLSEVPDGIATAAAASENAVDYGVESDGHDDIRTHRKTWRQRSNWQAERQTGRELGAF